MAQLCGMYQLPPPIPSNFTVDLPKNVMYQMRNYQDSGSASAIDSSMACSPDAMALLKRQDIVLNWLKSLMADVTMLKQKLPCSSNAGIPKSVAATSSSAINIPTGSCKDMVLSISPNDLPVSVLIMLQMMKSSHKLFVTFHQHSSVLTLSPECTQLMKHLSDGTSARRAEYSLICTVIWKNVDRVQLMLGAVHQAAPIRGEGPVCRFLAALCGLSPLTTEVEECVDRARHVTLRQVKDVVSSRHFLSGDTLTLADVITVSHLVKKSNVMSGPPQVKDWITRVGQVTGATQVVTLLS